MFKKAKLLQLVVICIGIPVGMLLSNRSVEMHEALDHANAIQHSSMDHGLFDIGGDDIIPKITGLTVAKDKMSGYNISIATQDFIFSPASVNANHVSGQGHAHLYINGEKFARLYAPHFHVPDLAGPVETIRVTLNANSHETLAVGDEVIEWTWQTDES